jgi:hypothetical protein
VIVRNQRGERRVSPGAYKLLLTAHIMISGAWLGVVVAKVVLAFAAATAGAPDVSSPLYAATQVVNPVFPPAAIGTIVSGVLLSLGTRWGLLDYYWVVVKLVLTVGVIATAIQIGDRFVQQSIALSGGPAASDGMFLGLAWAPLLLISVSVAHALMLSAATVLSVYKPWGMTWYGRRALARREAQPNMRQPEPRRDASARLAA